MNSAILSGTTRTTTVAILKTLLILIASATVCSLATMAFWRAAPMLGMLDPPGGRKTHAQPIPVVGGLGVFVSLLIMSSWLGLTPSNSWFLFAISVVIAAGLWDDVSEVTPSLKFAVQVGGSGMMVFGAGLQLSGVGNLIGWGPIGLSVLAVPLTVFSMVGVVNSFNMIDGIDGLAGSIALVALGWFLIVATDLSLLPAATTLLVLCGAVSGFLVFNLRFPWQRHARVFLGDAGSMMLGFALGWFAIDLTQAAPSRFPPISALWIVLLPLADCVSVMIRRLRARGSPFQAGRNHIHHFLLAHGFSHGQTLAILVGCSTVFGAVGYFGWRLKIPEPWMFFPFAAGFFVYHILIGRAWAKLRVAAIDTPDTRHRRELASAS